jgi:hypothetical protein
MGVSKAKLNKVRYGRGKIALVSKHHDMDASLDHELVVDEIQPTL